MWRTKPLSLIELRHLRYFLAAVEHGSFRKAGIALGVQESSISRRVWDLEDRLGASLFQRYNSGVVLTYAGQQFLRQTCAAMKHLGNGAIDVGSTGRSESGHIHVGLFSSLASGFLAGLFEAYDADCEAIRIEFSEGHPTEHVAAVRRQQIDIAFVTGTLQHTGCESTYLWSEQVFAVLPATHPRAENRLLTWEDLIGETFVVSEQAPGREIHALLIRRLSNLGRHPEVHRQNVGCDNLMSLVAIGHGITLTSEAMISTCYHGLVYRRIVGEMLPFSAVWSPKNDNPALRRLLSMARARREIVEPTGLPMIPPCSS